MAKVSVASVWLDACAGCHMSFLDLDEKLIDLLDSIELKATPVTDFKKITPVDVGIIEGAVSNEHDEEIAKELRANCKILMVWGDCAVFGGIVGMRNLVDTKEMLDRYYHTESSVGDIIPCSEELPELIKVRPVDQVVKVDCYVPGCPPRTDSIYYALSELLQGRIPVVPAEIMRFD